MPSGHGRDDYTLERMLERRKRNDIRKALQQNGRRLTAREIDIVNICTRHPDQRYTLFSYNCPDCECLRVNPYLLPNHPVHDHHQQQQLTVGSSSSNPDSSGSTSVVAPFLLQMNVGANATNSPAVEQGESDHPSTSRVTLPCYLITDGPESSASSGEGLCSTVNLIADSILKTLNSCSDRGNLVKDSSDMGNAEKGSPDKAYSKRSSRKKSKKKKKNRKKGGAKHRTSETQARSDDNLSEEPSASSDSASSSHAETSLVDGDRGDQRVKSDTETMLRCFSSNSSERCHADVSCSNSVLSGDEGDDTEPALPEIVGPAEDADHEDSSALEEVDKEDRAQYDACSGSDFIPVVSGRRGRYGRKFSQQGGKPSRFAGSSGRNADWFPKWQEKPLKIESCDRSAEHTKDSKQRESRTEISLAHESSKKAETSGKPDSKADARSGPTELLVYSRKDCNRNCSGSGDLGESLFKKGDFPGLPMPSSSLKEVVRHKVGPRPPRRDNLKKPPIPLPQKSPEQCKESESEVAVTRLSAHILEVKIGEIEESGSGCGSSSSSGAFFSPDSSKSSQMNQSSHDTSGLDSPRSSKASDETQLRPDTCPSDANRGYHVSQSGDDITASDPVGDNSTANVTQSDREACPSDFNSNTLTDIDASRSGSSICSSPDITAPISPCTNMSCLNIGEPKNIPAVYRRDLEEILGAVQASHGVQQMAEMVQAALGGPLADYELLCRYASPVVELPPYQIAGLPLQKIWRWYEEPSCFALEVRGCHDHQRLVGFTAHFVPSLSAVQLFLRRDSLDVSGIGAGSAELAFEYFEYEQPHNRLPLFDKVKELVAGAAHGKNLEALRLGDLHPASWYCVAWYPAYRVPEGRGSFKAAFLTYHSLAHFVQGAAAAVQLGEGRVSLSSPVVGLMSYNTKEESWYHQRYQAGGELMAERLGSLNLTAALMARARVMRGSQESGNYHPDFEFFESRRYQ